MIPPSQTSSRAPRSWGRIAAWSAGSLLLLALVAYFSFSFLLNQFLHSEAFRVLLNERTSAFFKADGEYLPIQCNGFSFYSDGYSARGFNGTAVKELRADQIRADFEPVAVFEGAWQVSQLQVQKVKVVLRAPDQTIPDASAIVVPPSATEVTPRASWIPHRFELQRARIEEAHLEWSPPGGAGSLTQMRLILEPNGHELVATGYGGQLNQTGCPVLKVDHVRLRCRYPELFITESQLQLGETGNLYVSGQAGLGESKTLDFLVKFSGIAISPFLPEDWRAGVKGNALGDARVIGSMENPEQLQATGTVRLAGGQLEALPILEKIAKFTNTRQFRQFALQRAEAEFIATKAKTTLSKLVAESEGLIRIEGGCVVEGRTLQGTFQLGVTPSSLRWLPGSRAKVFTQERDGYVWTPLKVSGPLDHLNEDLSARLAAAAGDAMIEEVKGAVENGAQGIKGTLEKGAKSLLDFIKPMP